MQSNRSEVGFGSTDLHPVCIAFSKLCNTQVMKHQRMLCPLSDENFMHQFSQSRSPPSASLESSRYVGPGYADESQTPQT